MKLREKLVHFLIGHGPFKADEFQFLIATQPNDHIPEGEAFITKDELQAALKPCQGDILIVCNARYSRHLVSEHWVSVLGQAANPPLSYFGLGYFKGSAFTACLVEQVAHKYGLRCLWPTSRG